MKNKLFAFFLIAFLLVGGFYLFKLNGSKKSSIDCKDCNLIMISLSNVSAKNMSLYGYNRVTTPNLDKWSENAFVFNNAFTQTSWTLPVGTSLFTSLYPYSHGVIGRTSNNQLDEKIKTFPEILKESGYKTAAFTGGLDYISQFGHMRGFQSVKKAEGGMYDANFAGFKQTLGDAKNWINENQKNKFFLFLHGYDAHCPFDPPKEVSGKFADPNKGANINRGECVRGYKSESSDKYEAYYYRSDREGKQKFELTQNDVDYLEASYDEEVLSIDKQVSDFLTGLDKKIQDNTVVLVFSDHGEMFAKHGRFGRAGATRGTLYDDTLNIPLMIKVPGTSGKKVDGLVQTIDIMPSLLKILNISSKNKMQGKSFIDLMTGKSKEINDYLFTGNSFGFEEFNYIHLEQSLNESIRGKEWKLIREIVLGGEERRKSVDLLNLKSEPIAEERYELYNLKDDPNEDNNLIDKEKEIAESLKQKLNAWRKESINTLGENSKTKEIPGLNEESKKRGYW